VEPCVVSVVLIAFDDRHRVGRAIASALSQPGPALEVVVVDDGSTDGTADVAQEWAARDDRVRVVRRPTNSGGCGAPRNDGLDAATGRYAMFLDSDDELESGAVERLVAAADRSGADVVLGRARRYNEDVGTSVPWRPGVLTPLGATTAAECPALVRDTLVVDKLYRRSFLTENAIRFPTDIHYEDLVFTAQVYARCRTVEITDIPVYVWYVRAVDGDRSITNRRAELRNITDRVEASRRADAALADAGRDDLRVVKDRKFVEDDLALYLRDLPDQDTTFGRAVLDVVAPYVATLRPEATTGLGQPAALSLALLAAGDAQAVVEASSLAYRGRVPRPLTHEGDVWRWPGLDGPAGDVTALVRRLTRWGLHLEHDVTGIEADEQGLRLHLRTTDPLGLLQSRPVRLLVLTRARGRIASLRAVRARDVQRSQRALTWQVRLPLDAALRAASVPGELQLRVLARRGRTLGLGPLFVAPDTVRDVAFGTRLGARSAAGRAFRHAGGYLGLTRTS
jgi:CDP-glycerol glycerophosphotransferase